MDDLYSWLVRGTDVSALNAILLALVFFFTRARWIQLIDDLDRMKKKQREYEMTFIRHGLEIEREDV